MNGSRRTTNRMSFLAYPKRALLSFKHATIGHMKWGYFSKRLAHYLRNPKALGARLMNMHIKHMSVRHFARGIYLYATHPSLIPERIARIAINRYLFAESQTQRGLQTFSSPNALTPFADQLFRAAIVMYGANPLNLPKATALMVAAWALTRNTVVAIHLAGMMIKMNRNRQATHIYRTALIQDPGDRQLWFHTGIHLLRHGTREEIMEFYDNILLRAPDEPLSLFVQRVYKAFPLRVASLTIALNATPHEKKHLPKLVIGCAAWGKTYSEMFASYALASLLTDGNIPAIADKYDVVVVVFTTPADASVLKETKQYKMSTQYCRFHFEFFESHDLSLINSPDQDVANTVKFALMSGSHYAIIESGRKTDAVALLFGADNVVNATFLTTMDGILNSEPNVAAIAIPGYRVYADDVRPVLESNYRRKDGILSITSDQFDRFICRFMPEPCFVDSDHFSRFPLFLCWKVGDNGIVVHANHHMPTVIRCSALEEEVTLSIDPVDGRFLHRYLKDLGRIHLLQSSEMALFDIADNPLVDQRLGQKFNTDEIAVWLWCYTDDLREKYFCHSIGYGIDQNDPAFISTKKTADRIIEEILARLAKLESSAPFLD